MFAMEGGTSSLFFSILSCSNTVIAMIHRFCREGTNGPHSIFPCSCVNINISSLPYFGLPTDKSCSLGTNFVDAFIVHEEWQWHMHISLSPVWISIFVILWLCSHLKNSDEQGPGLWTLTLGQRSLWPSNKDIRSLVGWGSYSLPVLLCIFDYIALPRVAVKS